MTLTLVAAFNPAAAGNSNGFALAIALIVVMALAVLYVGAALTQAWRGRVSLPIPPLGMDILIPALCILGLGVAGYLAYVETQHTIPICGPVGDCESVQTSSYAYLFGVLPVGVFGLMGYIAILVVWFWGRFRSDRLADYAPLATLGLTVFGVLFSLWLTYLEPFVIHAVCAWCLTSAVLMTLLMVSALPQALASLEPGTDLEDSPAGVGAGR